SLDFSLDELTASFVLKQKRALPFGLNALGNVVVGAEPEWLAGDRSVDDRNRAPVRGLHHPAEGLALRHRVDDLGAVLVHVDVEAAGGLSIVDDVEKCTAGLHDLARQPVHVEKPVVTDDKPLSRIEHDDALRHVIDRDGDQAAASAPATAPRESP